MSWEDDFVGRLGSVAARAAALAGLEAKRTGQTAPAVALRRNTASARQGTGQVTSPRATSAIPPKAVVAIELGINRSGFAFSLRGKAEGEIFFRVPQGNQQGEKTETAVLLSSENYDILAFGHSARERYIENKASGRLFRNFMKDFPQPLAVAECTRTVPLVRLMTAILGHFKTTAVEHLTSASEAPVMVTDVAWAMAVPASYDTIARRLIQEAAVQGGIIDSVDSPRLKLYDRPNAAYLAVYDQESQELRREVGTKTMIIDCGANTVDITTHEVVSLNPVRLKEIVPPTTGAWGSTCVDSAFQKWFKEFVGQKAYRKIRLEASFFDLMEQWEKRKTKFEGKPQDRVRLSLADISDDLGFDAKSIQGLRTVHNEGHIASTHVKGKDFTVILPSQLVKSFFTLPLGMIRSCLHDMQRSFQRAVVSIDHIFLVGGFSSSPLVQATVHEELDGGGCVVKSPVRPDVAVVKGAVLANDNRTIFDATPLDLLSVLLLQEKENHDETKQLLDNSRRECFAAQNKLKKGVGCGGRTPAPCSKIELQTLEIKHSLTIWLSELAEDMREQLGPHTFVLPHLLARLSLESQALVEKRRLEVHNFFLCGSDVPATAVIDMNQATADFMLKHMRLYYKDIFPLKGVHVEGACDTIVERLVVWTSGRLEGVSREEAAKLVEGTRLREVIKRHLDVFVSATLQDPRMEFEEDCGFVQAFNPQVHAPSIDGDALRPGDNCVVVFPALKAVPCDKGYILPARGL